MKRAETNAEVITEFWANRGRVAAPYDNPRRCCSTRSARQAARSTSFRCAMPAGESLYVFATAHGSARHPDWHHNVVAHPDIMDELGSKVIPVRATVVSGEERASIFARQVARFPVLAEYERSLGRAIPVIRLSPGHLTKATCLHAALSRMKKRPTHRTIATAIAGETR